MSQGQHDHSGSPRAAGSYKSLLYPLSFVRSGNYNLDNGYPVNQGTNLNYWSATATTDDAKSYELNSNSNNTNSSNEARKAAGLAVRCVARRAE